MAVVSLSRRLSGKRNATTPPTAPPPHPGGVLAQVDWDYNKTDPTNIYRPWGFQPGHQAEWAKNLLNLHRHGGGDGDSGWMVPRAKALFDGTWALSWDAEVSADVAHKDPVS